MVVPSSARTRGSSLIEVLVAMTIIALMMVAVLEMFSLSLLTNHGSAARTEMTFKAQQVVENLRYAQLTFKNLGTAPAGSATFPLAAGTYNLPFYSGDTTGTNGGTWAYWGPAGADVMEQDKGPFRITYGVQDLGTNWAITVTATPSAPAAGTKAYFASSSKSKRIEYVAQIAK
ncbi:MAG: prepilin-type N-terminal cleavage/methylation domain-containing protein [Thermoanaerobaculia bacterium]